MFLTIRLLQILPEAIGMPFLREFSPVNAFSCNTIRLIVGDRACMKHTDNDSQVLWFRIRAGWQLMVFRYCKGNKCPSVNRNLMTTQRFHTVMNSPVRHYRQKCGQKHLMSCVLKWTFRLMKFRCLNEVCYSSFDVTRLLSKLNILLFFVPDHYTNAVDDLSKRVS